MILSNISFETIILEPIKYFLNCQFQIFTFVGSGIIRIVCNITTHINKKHITYIYVDLSYIFMQFIF